MTSRRAWDNALPRWWRPNYFNERAGRSGRPVYGCVTTGEDWQFMRLDGSELIIDPSRRYINQVGAVLAALLASVN